MFDDKARLSLIHNLKMMMDYVKKEWYAKSSFEIATTETHCQLCETKNTYVCYIENRINGEILHVGNMCVKRFKDINGVNVALTQLNKQIRNTTKEARRSKFDVALGNDIHFAKKAKEKLESFPVLLPYKLYQDIDKSITNCNRLRTVYISSGGSTNEYISKFRIEKTN